MSTLKTMELMEVNELAHWNPEYDRMMRNRPGKKHRVFEICDGGYFVTPCG